MDKRKIDISTYYVKSTKSLVLTAEYHSHLCGV